VTDDDETVAPTPKPPSCSKRELYADPVVFEELEERVFNVSALVGNTWPSKDWREKNSHSAF
jgi:hypothetical protein